ncbi:NYN domain-containing protein [Candidatus Parcubacteria bacterium]|nr:MAG: NYN domain-containing protein [Candidatus Parcubacteria bacterium]
MVDAENLFFSVANKYGAGIYLNFARVVKMLEKRFGPVRILVCGFFSDENGKGLLYTIKAHLMSLPDVTVIDTRTRPDLVKEVSDRVMVEEIFTGSEGPNAQPKRYERCIFMTGDRSMLRSALYIRDKLGVPVTIIGEEGTINRAYNNADIEVIHLDPVENDLLVTERVDSALHDLIQSSDALNADNVVERFRQANPHFFINEDSRSTFNAEDANRARCRLIRRCFIKILEDQKAGKS